MVKIELVLVFSYERVMLCGMRESESLVCVCDKWKEGTYNVRRLFRPLIFCSGTGAAAVKTYVRTNTLIRRFLNFVEAPQNLTSLSY